MGADDDAQEQGEGKVVQHLPSGQGERDEDQNDGQRHNDGPAQNLVHGIVDDCLEGVPMAYLEVFPDPVEDHDGIRQGVPRQRQEGGDDQEGDLLIVTALLTLAGYSLTDTVVEYPASVRRAVTIRRVISFSST